MPVIVVARSAYASYIPEAKRLLDHRDPDDVELLALALETEAPLWSNDEDFAEGGVSRYTTAELLKVLDTRKT